MPVLGLIHIAAKDPKWANTETQTECSIGCHMGHVVTQFDSAQLENMAQTSLTRLQSIVSQIRKLEDDEEED